MADVRGGRLTYVMQRGNFIRPPEPPAGRCPRCFSGNTRRYDPNAEESCYRCKFVWRPWSQRRLFWEFVAAYVAIAGAVVGVLLWQLLK